MIRFAMLILCALASGALVWGVRRFGANRAYYHSCRQWCFGAALVTAS